MSNTINWFHGPRSVWSELTKVSLDKENEGKLTPKEEAEMIAFLDRYTPAGANA